MLRHKRTSRKSDHPPFSRSESDASSSLYILASFSFFGNSWPNFSASAIVDCTLFISFVESQLTELWWTPLKRKITGDFFTSLSIFVTIRQCEKLSELLRSSHKAYVSNICNLCSEETNHNYNHHNHRKTWSMIWFRAKCFGWTPCLYCACLWSKAILRPRRLYN